MFDPADANLCDSCSSPSESDVILFGDNAAVSNAPNQNACLFQTPTCTNTQTINVSGIFVYGASVQLSSSALAADAGTPVTIKAIVTPLSENKPAANPTGTVTFLSGQASLGSFPLVSGIATVTTASLPVGTDIITANYSGDANYVGETTVSGITVTVGNADYSISANPSSLILAAGQSGSTVITLTPASPEGYNGTVSLSCGNLPSYITCVFTPSNSVTFTSGVTTAQMETLNVTVLANIAMLDLHRPFLAAMAMPLGLLAVLPIVGRKRKRLRLCIVFAALTITLGGAIAGCSSSNSGSGSNSATGRSAKLYCDCVGLFRDDIAPVAIDDHRHELRLSYLGKSQVSSMLRSTHEVHSRQPWRRKPRGRTRSRGGRS